MKLDKYILNWSVVSTNSPQQVIHTLQSLHYKGLMLELFRKVKVGDQVLSTCGYKIRIPGVPKKSIPQNQKRKLFFTKTYCQGMKVIVVGKSNRPRGPRPVEMINFNKTDSSIESETNGQSTGHQSLKRILKHDQR